MVRNTTYHSVEKYHHEKKGYYWKGFYYDRFEGFYEFSNEFHVLHYQEKAEDLGGSQ